MVGRHDQGVEYCTVLITGSADVTCDKVPGQITVSSVIQLCSELV